VQQSVRTIQNLEKTKQRGRASSEVSFQLDANLIVRNTQLPISGIETSTVVFKQKICLL
jgi:hypothetical protein